MTNIIYHPNIKTVIVQIKDDILEDKGRLQARGNGVEICLLPGQSLSREQERDCHLTETKSGPRHS